MQDANARLEEMKKQSERRIRELEFQVSQLSLENTKLKQQLHVGVPLASSTLGSPPTPLRPSSRSARKTVEAIAETSVFTGMSQQFPRRATLSGGQIHDITALAVAPAISPIGGQRRIPPGRQHMSCFNPEFTHCPRLLDHRQPVSLRVDLHAPIQLNSY